MNDGKLKSENIDLFAASWDNVTSQSKPATIAKISDEQKNDPFGLAWTTDNSSNSNKPAATNFFDTDFGSQDKKSNLFANFETDFGTQSTTTSKETNAFDTNWPSEKNVEKKGSNSATNDIMSAFDTNWSSGSNANDQNREDTNKNAESFEGFGSVSWNTSNQTNSSAFDAFKDESKEKEDVWKSTLERANDSVSTIVFFTIYALIYTKCYFWNII